jgi:hypothetical protein
LTPRSAARVSACMGLRPVDAWNRLKAISHP